MSKRDIVDVLIVGAGASGAAFAWSLAKAGFDVLCLEQGKWINPTSYPSDQQDWEVRRQTDFHPNPNVRRLPEDYPINTENSSVEPVMYNAVGGSTIHWTAHWPRLHPSDFRVKTLDEVGVDWPVTYHQIEPFYDMNDKMMGIAGLVGDTAYPPKSPRQTRPLPLGKPGDTLARGFNKLGWHWWPSDSAILADPYDGRPACNNGGPCDVGCPTKAKASTDVTYWPKAIEMGAKLETGSRVREITITRDGLANGVVYFNSKGEIREQTARVVVMACNGVGTPRLLLNSTSNLFPDGLANSSGRLGKNLMFHPIAMVLGVFEEEMDGYKGAFGCNILSHEFYETDLSRGFVRGVGFQILRGSPPLHEALGSHGGHRIPWGEDHRKIFLERFNHTVSIGVVGEDLPELHNEVTLDAEITDNNGIPAPSIRYRLSSNSKKMMDFGTARATEVMRAAGATRVLVNPHLRPSGFHLLGTAGMGKDAGTSVVNCNGRAHDVKNLFIIDGSIFPTAGSVNPTSTIQAMALYIAKGIQDKARYLLD